MINVKNSSLFTIAVALLLVSIFFVGAGSALTNGQTVLVYEKVPGLTGSWTDGENTIVASDIGGYGVFMYENLVEGTYTNETLSIDVRYPTVKITCQGTNSYLPYPYRVENGGTIYLGDEITFTGVSNSPNVKVIGFYVTFPDGVIHDYRQLTDGTFTLSTDSLLLGPYKLQAIFGDNIYSFGNSEPWCFSKNTYTYVLTNPPLSISSTVAEVLQGEVVHITIFGRPGEPCSAMSSDFHFVGASFTITNKNGDNSKWEFSIPMTGKADLFLTSNEGFMGVGNIEVTNIAGETQSTSIKVVAPTPSQTQTQTPASTPSQTQTQTPTSTPSQTQTQTPTPTSSQTQTQTPTPISSQTQTQIPTPTPSQTQTQTPTPTPSQTQTQTPTPTPSQTDIEPVETVLIYTPIQQPTKQPTSSLSVFAVLAGLGVVAVLRRK